MTESLRIVLATGNQNKVREIKYILGSVPVEFMTLLDFPHVVAAEETGATFEDNAVAKALHVRRETGLASLADDSGLEVDAMVGMPDGRRIIRARGSGTLPDAQAIGAAVAQDLLRQGAAGIIENLKES